MREPWEYQKGFIPSAINIPFQSQPNALLLPEDDFEEKFGFEKPSPEKEVVFYCLAGVRSSMAAAKAQEGGYRKIGNYLGSWEDWEKRNQKEGAAS